MKKRLLSLILVLAIISVMLVAPVSALEATEENTTALTGQCPCGCGLTLEQVKWKPWDPNGLTDPEDGHYYLDGDYAQAKQYNIMSGNKVVLDLRGNVLTSAEQVRLFLVYGYLAVLDSVGGGRISAKTAGNGYGGAVMLSTNETLCSKFELFSGTLTMDADNSGSRRGGLVSVAATCEFNMYGGVVMNGSSQGLEHAEQGGCIASTAESAVIRILGGKVMGGYAPGHGGNIYACGTTVLKNCEIIGGETDSYGGNIYQSGGSLTVENCLISDGVSHRTTGTVNGGGNICTVNSASVSIKDSVIRNGYAAANGGNLFFGSGEQTLENTAVTAGVCGLKGGNLAVVGTGVATTLDSCTIDGDVFYAGKLTLKGTTKIGLNNNGLNLLDDSVTAVVSAAGLTEGAEIFVNAGGLFTEAGADPDYFKPAIRTVLTETEEGIVGTQAAAGEQGGYCPHCYDPADPQMVTWQEFSTTGSLIQACYSDAADDTDPACTGKHIESGHYYLSADNTAFSQHYIGAVVAETVDDATAYVTKESDDVTLDLNGYDITSSGRAFYVRQGDDNMDCSSFAVLDSVGGAVVAGKGANNQGGGVLYGETAHLAVYGGKYVYNSGKTVRNGGVVYSGGTMEVYGGIFDGSAYENASYSGGAIYQSGAATKALTVTAGRFVGGSAKNGGTLFISSNTPISITGGQFHGGTAGVTGGNINVVGTSSAANGSFRMSGCSVTDGYATTSAGNFHVTYYKTAAIEDCYFANGSTADYGGNIVIGPNNTYAAYENCIITGGSAKRGGNLYAGGTYARATFTDCFITDGTATTYGGNLHAGNGYVEFYGGVFSYGSSGTYGGNASGTLGNRTDSHLLFAADSEGKPVQITGGSAATLGGNLYISGAVELRDAQVHNGKAVKLGQDIYLGQGSNTLVFTVGEGLAGDISLYAETAHLGTPAWGNAIAGTVCSELNAKLTLEGDYGAPELCAADGVLYVAAAAVVNANGAARWYTNNADAIDACGEDSYVKLYTTGDVVLTKDCAVDLNGNAVNVSGDYTLYGMDSSGDDLSVGTGRAVWAAAENVKTSQTFSAPNGKHYVAITEGTDVTYHCLDMGITGASIRPSVSGIYYTGTWGCDEVLAAQLDTYGVAVSAVAMPKADFATDGSDSLWTVFDAAQMVNGETKTGVIIKDILKTEGRNAELNDAYGRIPVFATAYVTLKSGQTIISDDPDSQDDIGYSLHSLMTQLDDLIQENPTQYRRFTLAARNFYEQWKSFGMESWSFDVIPTPEEDDVIDVLMIGNSFCYYYVEELYELAKAAGIKMRVCNVYYSGCKIEWHWNWWKNGDAKYQFYTTDGDGRRGVSNVTLEWCLAQGQWDAISIHEANLGPFEPQTQLESLKPYLDELLPYLRTQFPDAGVYWQETWAFQLGYDRNGVTYETVQDQKDFTEAIHTFAQMIDQNYDITSVIPCGDAWNIVRDGGYDELTARLGKAIGDDPHAGDLYHEGDIGGGQYLNACVWLEILTGTDCRGLDYVPTYTYNGEVFDLNENITVTDLQNAAHQAVAQWKAENP